MPRKFLAVLALSVFAISFEVRAGGWDYVARHPGVLGPKACPFGSTAVRASMYGNGDGFHGRRTYCGSIFNHRALTFASNPRVPCGSRVTFTNPRNGRSVTATSTDYGPFGKARALGVKFDLSTGTAHAMGMRASQWVCVRL